MLLTAAAAPGGAALAADSRRSRRGAGGAIRILTGPPGPGDRAASLCQEAEAAADTVGAWAVACAPVGEEHRHSRRTRVYRSRPATVTLDLKMRENSSAWVRLVWGKGKKNRVSLIK